MSTLPVPVVSDLLPGDAWSSLLAMNGELAHAYATRQVFRTETEARISVLNDLHFPTPAAKYWQSVREQCVMLEQLALLSFEWRRNEVKIKKLSEYAGYARDQEERQIDLDECLFKRANMLLVAKDRHREIVMWEMLKNEGIAADPTFDRDDVNAHQLVSYTKQFVLRAHHSDAGRMSGAELDNLIGQLRTGVRRAVECGVIKQVLDGLPEAAAEQVRPSDKESE